MRGPVTATGADAVATWPRGLGASHTADAAPGTTTGATTATTLPATTTLSSTHVIDLLCYDVTVVVSYSYGLPVSQPPDLPDCRG
jgi:hypothetical protein